MKLLLTGLPGSGKTTQARIISEKLNLPMISTGNILRDLVKENSEQAAKVREDLESGRLVDDNIVADIVREKLTKTDEGGFVFDGYPRSLEQLHIYDPGYDKVIYLKANEEVIKERLMRRGRHDDNPEVVEERFDVYHHETEPLIEYFKEAGILETVDAAGEVDEVTARIEAIINNG